MTNKKSKLNVPLIRKHYPHLNHWHPEWIVDFSAFAVYYFPQVSKGNIRLSGSQIDFCKFLQPNIFTNELTKKKSILAHRGYGKSQIVKMIILWYLSLFPHETVIYFASTDGFAGDIGQSVRSQIKQRPEFAHLDTDGLEGEYTNQQTRFDTPYKPLNEAQCSFTALTMGSSERIGKRSSFIICDDLETEGRATHELFQRKLETFYSGLDALQSDPQPHHATINLGTPHCNDSIHMKLVEEFNYETRIWPAIYPDISKCSEEYIKYLDPKIKKKVEDDPSIIGKSCSFIPLSKLKLKTGYPDSPHFRRQWQLDTTLYQGDIYPFRASDLIFASINRDYLPNRILWSNDEEHYIKCDFPGFNGDGFYRNKPISDDVKDSPPHKTVMFIDAAAGAGTDEEVYCVMSALHGNMFLHDIDGFLGDDKKKNHALTIALVAQNWKVDKIVLESNQGVEIATNSIRSSLQNISYHCSVETQFQRGNKAERIYSTMYYLLNRHSLIIDRRLISKDAQRKSFSKTYQLFYQLTHYQNTKHCGMPHDDRIDCVSSCINQLTSFVSTDYDTVEEDHAESYKKAFNEWLKGKGKNPAGRICTVSSDPNSINIGDPYPFDDEEDNHFGSIRSMVNNSRQEVDLLRPSWL